MWFNVSGLLCGRVGNQHRFHFEGETLDHEGVTFRDIEARGVLTRTDRTVLVEADAKAVFSGECSRCLEESVMAIEVHFAEEFVPVNRDLVTRRAKTWLAAADDDDLPRVDDSNTLDLSLPLWQTLRAGLPMVPLCEQDCRGICAECYRNLNADACSCSSID